MGNKSSSVLQDEEIKKIGEETGFTHIQIEKLHSRFAQLDRSNCGSLNKNDLMSIPELALNPLCDRLIQTFFSENDQEDEQINFTQFMRVLATFRSTNNANSAPNNSGKSKMQTQSQVGISPNKQEDVSRYNSHKIRQETSDPTGRVDDTSRDEVNGKSDNGNHNNALHKKLSFIFKIYDVDNDGKISFNDLRRILKIMVGSYIEDVQLDKIATRAFVEVDENSDGFIEFNEFCRVFNGKDLDDKMRVKFFY